MRRQHEQHIANYENYRDHFTNHDFVGVNTQYIMSVAMKAMTTFGNAPESLLYTIDYHNYWSDCLITSSCSGSY
jgi:hypothetical protein